MATVNSTTTLSGLFKNIYADKVLDLLPDSNRLTRELNFKFAEALGDKYIQPVTLTAEHGVTYSQAGVEDPTLEDPTASETKPAQVDGSQIFSRARINYEAWAKASGKGDKAFMSATGMVIRNLLKATGKALEISLLHGRRGRGTLQSVAGAGTTRDWVIYDDSWAAGIWAGSKNMKLDVYAADYSTKINTNAAVVITAINVNTRTLSVSGNATDLTNITADMHLFQRTGSPTTEMAGIDAIIKNTGSLFNIDAATYELWKGNVLTSTGSLDMDKVLNGVRTAVDLGLEGDTLCIVSPKAFQVLNNNVAALRVYDQSYKTKEGANGVEEIQYYGQSGKTTIVPHMYQKNGRAHIIAPKEWKRIGAKDIGFMTAASGDAFQYFLDVPNSPSKELRLYFNGSAFCEAPAHAVVLEGITY